jgi:hypothetical protein
MKEEVMDAIFDILPEDLRNSEVASLLATIASAFSEGKDCNAAMHLNTAASMVLSKMIHETRTFN